VPFTGRPDAAAIAAALRDASLQARDALVETATGDASPRSVGRTRDVRERARPVRLRAGVARLVEHGIAVFIAVGSRDPQGRPRRARRLAEGVGSRSAPPPRCRLPRRDVAVVHGVGRSGGGRRRGGAPHRAANSTRTCVPPRRSTVGRPPTPCAGVDYGAGRRREPRGAPAHIQVVTLGNAAGTRIADRRDGAALVEVEDGTSRRHARAPDRVRSPRCGSTTPTTP
jgi:hypothetical protein